MRLCLLVVLLLPLVSTRAVAQDERVVKSPDGKLEFRIFTAESDTTHLDRLAYRVNFQGKRVVETSYLGLDILNQEPLLGEKPGLTSQKVLKDSGPYRSSVYEYIQNGSLGRRINVEIRVWNNAVAFRYQLPRSTPLIELVIADETTEFELAQDGPAYPAGGYGATYAAVSKLEKNSVVTLPLLSQQPGIGWIAIAETILKGFPPANLIRLNGTILRTRLTSANADSRIAYEGTTPFTLPWRIIMIGSDRESVMQPDILRELNQGL